MSAVDDAESSSGLFSALVRNRVAEAIRRRVVRANREWDRERRRRKKGKKNGKRAPFRLVIVLPLLPEFGGRL